MLQFPLQKQRKADPRWLKQLEDELMVLVIRRNLGFHLASRIRGGPERPLDEVLRDLRAEYLNAKRKVSHRRRRVEA